MVLKCTRKTHRVNVTYPNFTVSGAILHFVNVVRYFGHVLDDKLHYDIEVKRKNRNMFVRC